MPYSYTNFTGDGVTTNRNVSFPYLDQADITVKVNGVSTAFSWLTANTIQVSPAPANGAIGEIRRTSLNSSPIVEFQDASVLTEEQLNLLALYDQYIAEEASDAIGQTVSQDSTGVFQGQSRRAANFADPTSPQDLATKAYVDAGDVAGLNAATTATTQAGIATTQAGIATTQAGIATSSVATIGGMDLTGTQTLDDVIMWSTGVSKYVRKTLAYLKTQLGITAFGASLVSAANAAAGLTVLGAAPLASPTFTGTPSGPTPSLGTNTTQLATTAALQAEFKAPYLSFANKIRNGGFNVWQRGTSGTGSVGSVFTADGWVLETAGAATAWAQAGQFGSTKNMLQVTGAVGNTGTIIRQRIESEMAAPFKDSGNKQITIQAKIHNATGATITPNLLVTMANSPDNFGAVTTLVSSTALQACPDSTLTTVAYTFTANNSLVANGIEVKFDFGSVLNSGAKIIRIGEVDCRVTPGVSSGLNSSPPVPELRPSQVELALCQRYFERISVANGNMAGAGGSINIGFCENTQRISAFIYHKVTKRAQPTVTFSNFLDFGIRGTGGSSIQASSGTLNAADIDKFSIEFNTASAAVTAGGAGWWTNHSGNAAITISAEL